jgi:glutamate-5-semialdehyde dehydrogenase
MTTFTKWQYKLKLAKIEVDAGRLSASLFKRLDIEGVNEEKFMTMVEGVADVDKLEDPTGTYNLIVIIHVNLVN